MKNKEQILFVEYIGLSLNEFYKLHFHQKSKAKEICMRHVIDAINEYSIEVINYPVKMTFYPILGNNLSGRAKRAYDIVNYSSTVKMIEDSLVQLKILENDSNSFVYSHTIEKPTVDRTKNKTGMLIVIEEQEKTEEKLTKILKRNKIIL